MAYGEGVSVTAFRLPALASLVAVVLATAGLLAGPALAHADLVESQPADNARLAEQPSSITLTFNDRPLADSTGMVAQTPTGETIDLSPVSVSGTTATAAWPEGQPAGRFTVIWRNVGSDGHPQTGEFTFAVTTGTTYEPGPDTPAIAADDSTHTEESGGLPGWVLPVIALVVVLLVAGLAGWWIRRVRASADNSDERD